ncbi:hypothetical protein SAMN05216388_103811 [Halorientalis persicus]|uniref:Uncharacterized protein n=1 Tax=Halorientalis persicus TaxID=1367881 RepID=A0A1H8VIF2_9EURY|nr:hypothetical protein SAMN05216388_103811 [Halorientalis persicus]
MNDYLLEVFCGFAVILLLTGCAETKGSEQPSAGHSVQLDNYGNESAIFEISIVRNATGDIVHKLELRTWSR